MNVENPEVGRFTKKEKKKKKKGRIKVRSDKLQRFRERVKEERSTLRKRIPTYLGLGCIFLKTKHHAE